MKTAEELLELALPSVLEGIKKEMVQTIDWQTKDAAAKLVTTHVSEWITANILPEITKRLVEEKESLISLGTTLGAATVEAVSAAMLDQLKKNLEGYKRTTIFKALFD